ncbi:MAG: YciI family protein [Pseudomonadota bacterium]
MLFAITCTDGPKGAEARATVRPDHLEYLKSAGDAVKLAGALLDAAGEKPIGSLIIVEADTLDAAHAFADDDPYAKADAFAKVDIKPYRIALGALAP